MPKPTSAVWIIHNPTTVRAIRGLLQQLEAVDAEHYASVRIMAVDPTEHAGVVVPEGELTLPDGEVLSIPRDQPIPWDKLPAEGLLFFAQSKDDA